MSQGHVRIEAARGGFGTRIFLDDHEVSDMVVSYFISGSAKDITTLTLELVPVDIDITADMDIEARRAVLLTEPEAA